MIRNVIFDIGNVLMDFRWMEYMHSLFGEDEQTITAVNQAIWRHGTWVSMDEGTDEVTAIEKAFRLVPTHETEIRKAFAHAVGLTPETISMRLSGKRDFSRDEIFRIAQVLEIPYNDLEPYFFCVKS